MFELLSPEATGVSFANTLPEDSSFNVLDYLYYYNGGGVAAGDVNGDGLPDLYFSANLGPNKLYINTGNYRFEDVTARAGVAGPEGWKTGVTMADVNGDGRLDIYVSAVSYLTMHGHNVLYLNNGDGTFTDRTKELGLDFAGYSTQAAFFDYDGDGDLDMYLLNHSTHTERAVREAPSGERNPRAGDRLYRNDGGHFVDVSARAGIRDSVAFGLGVVASDLNGDGCPDLYVANDFQENDLLYLNNCDGTFADSIASATGHTSRFSMGVDAADFDDDLRPDLMVLDMLPEREEILKSSASTEGNDLFDLRLRAGYHPQYERNTLLLNRGRDRFSDIGFLAGVAATDWSWSPLIADLDNDGRKDLFITSGIYRRPNDLDYVDFVGNAAVQASLAKGVAGSKASHDVIAHMPKVPAPNHLFRNNGDLTFTNVAEAWGLRETGFSNGAVYVDLNNSGNLDLVVNRINAPAAIYRNRARQINGNHYLTIALRGAGANTAGIGTKVMVTVKGRTQLLEQMPTRGFESSVDPRLHVGLGADSVVDSLVIVWPDRRLQTLAHVAGDRVLSLSQQDAAGRYNYARDRATAPLFEDVTAKLGLDVKHAENTPYDFTREPLLPHLLSTEGPALAIGDANGDGVEDIFVGGAKWQAGRVLVQEPSGRFRVTAQPALAADSLAEDVDAAFFDANGDGHADLYVVSGGNEFRADADALQDRLYLNDGKGEGALHRDATALPRMAESGSCVSPADFDGDGDIDLFVGRRAVAGSYGLTPRSHLLRNDGKGHFSDATMELSPALASAGMVTSAAWIDYDGDGKLDLVVVGEWMPVRVFRQEAGKFVERTKETGLAQSEGWWNSVSVADVNGDGRPDLVLGNLGLNSYLRASAREPVRMYVRDFFGNGTTEQILTSYKRGVSYPLAGRDELLPLMPELRSKFPTHASYASSSIQQMFPDSELERATVLEARDFASSVAINGGKAGFRLHALPNMAQLSPVYASVTGDFDGDGVIDLLVGGNMYGVPPILGRYDASYGQVLRGTGAKDGSFVPVDVHGSGVRIEGQVRRMKMLRLAQGRGEAIVIARNNDSLQVLRLRR